MVLPQPPASAPSPGAPDPKRGSVRKGEGNRRANNKERKRHWNQLHRQLLKSSNYARNALRISDSVRFSRT